MVFVDFTVYNANVNLFNVVRFAICCSTPSIVAGCSVYSDPVPGFSPQPIASLTCSLVVEFPASGGAIVTPRFLTLRFLRNVTSWDRFVFACEIIFVVFTAYYLMEEIMELKCATLLHSTPLHSTPLYSTPLHSTPLHSTPLHSSMPLYLVNATLSRQCQSFRVHLLIFRC